MLKKACLLLALVFSANTFVFGQAGGQGQRGRVDNYGIRGKLLIPNQNVDERIEVRLEKAAMQIVQTAYTDSSGNFDFRNLTPGSYYISVTVDGFEPVRQLVEIYTNFSTASVTILLNKPPIEIRERRTALDAADPDVVDLTQMKENFPKKAVQNYDKALEERQKGHNDNAVKLLEEAIQIAPTFFHAHNNLGLLYQSMKRYDDAEREYKRSKELSPRSERPLVNLGSLYIELAGQKGSDEESKGKLLDDALDSLEAAVKLNARSALAQFLLGQANYKSDFLEEAQAAFTKARDLDPHMTSARLMLANVYMRLEKWQDVLDTLDSYLKDNPKATDRANVENMRARIAKNLRDNEAQPAAK